jgi:hypothetical protein
MRSLLNTLMGVLERQFSYKKEKEEYKNFLRSKKYFNYSESN